MKVGLFTTMTGTQAGGLETYERNLIEALASIDKRSEYCVYNLNKADRQSLSVSNNNFQIQTLPSRMRWMRLLSGLPQVMIRDDVDLLHATFVPPPFSPRPYVFTMHEVAMFNMPRVYPLKIRLRMTPLIRRALTHAQLILCVSASVRDFLAERFAIPDERMTVVYNGCSSRFRPMNREANGRLLQKNYALTAPYILFCGRIEPRKNVVRIIQAFDRFRRESSTPMKLVLAGKMTWSSRHVARIIRTLGLKEHIVELGYVHPEHLPHLYSGAEMLAFPSLWEGFGLPAVEAMACGTPVIASNCSALPEVTNGAALLVDPYSVEDIATAMFELATNKKLWNTLRMRGLLRAKEFTWEKTAHETLNAYNRAIEMNG